MSTTWSIIGAVGLTLCGALFGWLFNEISQWNQYRGEKRRVINRVIYNLLNIRFELKRMDLGGLSEKLIEKINATQNDPLPYGDVNQIEQIVNTEGKDIVEFRIFENLEEIKDHFDDVLQDFASIDPVEAYRLSDEAKIFNQLDDLEDALGAIEKKYGKALGGNVFEQIEEHLRDTIFKDSIDALEKEIKQLAERTDKESKEKILDKLELQNNVNIEEGELNQFIKGIEKGLN